MPTLAQVNVAGLVQELSNRLGDTFTYWTNAELVLYVQEALRTWNAVALYWKERIAFATAPNVPFYDLAAEAAAQFGYAYSDYDLIQAIEHHLLEPANPTGWSGSDQFTYQDVITAFDRRRNRFSAETHAILQQYPVPQLSPPPADRTQLDNVVLDIHRADWFDTASLTWSHLWRDDDLGIFAFGPTASTSLVPQAYSVALVRPLEIRLFPAPQNVGALELLSVPGFTTPAPGAAPSPVGLPDDFAWGVKWGALADLLQKDAQSRDATRAQYAELRYQHAVQLAKQSPSVLQVGVNGVTMAPSSMQSLDAYLPNWRNTTGPPQAVAIAGRNLVCVGPVPNGVYGLTFDVLRNAPVTDVYAYFQIHADVVEAVVGYAQHLAAFKMGGAEFDSTQWMAERFLDYAQQRRKRQGAQGTLEQALTLLPAKENEQVPYEVAEAS